MNGAQLNSPQTRGIEASFSHREKNSKMKVLTALLAAVVALTPPFNVNAFAEPIQQPASPALNPAQDPTAPPTGTPTTNLPAQSEPQGSAPLRVMVGKS